MGSSMPLTMSQSLSYKGLAEGLVRSTIINLHGSWFLPNLQCLHTDMNQYIIEHNRKDIGARPA